MELFVTGAAAVFQPQVLLLMVGGVLLGLTFGSIPGISATTGMILLLPLTFFLPPLQGVMLLIAIWLSGTYAGSIPAIVLNIPGTAASVATAIDGYALSQQGQAPRALRASIVGSVFGGLVSAVALVFFSPPLAELALQFRPPEMFAFALFGMTIIVSLSSGALARGALAGVLGMLLASVGFGPAGTARFAYSVNLLDGFPIVVILIGLFTFPQILELLQKGAITISQVGQADARSVEPMDRLYLLRARDFARHGLNLLRSAVIGVVVGILPGSGPTVAGFVGYSEAKRASKDKDSFGKGNIDGVISAETANNASILSSLIPTLTLAIPGSVVAVIVLAALQMHGIVAGPRLFQQSGDLVAAIFIGVFVVQFVLLAAGLTFGRFIALITRVPVNVLTPIVFAMALAGAYSVRNNVWDVIVATFIGFVGYGLHLLRIPLSPLILAAILGPIVERNWYLTYQLYSDDWGRLATRPIFLLLMGLTVLTLLVSTIREARTNRRMASIHSKGTGTDPARIDQEIDG